MRHPRRGMGTPTREGDWEELACNRSASTTPAFVCPARGAGRAGGASLAAGKPAGGGGEGKGGNPARCRAAAARRRWAVSALSGSPDAFRVASGPGFLASPMRNRRKDVAALRERRGAMRGTRACHFCATVWPGSAPPAAGARVRTRSARGNLNPEHMGSAHAKRLIFQVTCSSCCR